MFDSSEALTSAPPGSSGRGSTRGPSLCRTCIPSRFVFVILSFFGVVLAYAYKVVISVAIVSMVGLPPKNSSQTALPDTCPPTESSNSSNVTKIGEFSRWDDHTQAIVLGGFFYGYVVTQIPAGVFSERFGAKWIFGGSMFGSALLSLLGPIAARSSSTLFLVTRIGQGLCEGVVFPCMNAMISRWMPKMERSRGTTIIFTGAQIGTVITLPLAGFLCDSTFLGGWPSVFYVLGIAGCVWFALWALLVYEDPDSHPFISQEEYDYIIKDQGIEKSSGKRITPWKDILTSVPVYALIITHFGQNWGFLTILTLLPTYFEKNSLMSSLPYLMQAIVAWIASFITDKLRQKQVLAITTIRKINNTIAFLGSAVCLCAVALVKCNVTLSILFFILAMGLNGCSFSGFNSTHVDMAPDFAGTLMGMTNSIGNIPGFIAPLVAEAFYDKGHTLTHWSYVFYLSAAIYVVTGLIYLFFASARLQSWGLSRNGENLHLNQNKGSNVVYTVEKTLE